MAAINRIAGIVLAAGASTRMGSPSRPKQLLTFEGQTLLRRAAESAIAAELSPVVIVLGDDPAGLMRSQVDNLLVSVTINPQWRAGMGTSVRAGMHTLAAFGPLRGVALMLCDQPLVTGTVLRRLIEPFSQMASGIAASSYRDTLGVPAVFGPEYFAQLRALPDAQGAKTILLRNAAHTRPVPLPEAATDIDDASAYANLIGVCPPTEFFQARDRMAKL